MDVILKGIILGFTEMGATHIKTTTEKIYFEITEGSEWDNKKLLRASILFKDFGLTLMIKKLK